jgi:hypothetical protein
MLDQPETLAYLGLSGFISASHDNYKKCIDVIDHEHTVAGVKAVMRLHHLKFDANGKPMIEALAEVLYNHIIDYCIASRNRSSFLSAQESAKFTKEARKLFIHPPATEDDPDRTGEAGEMLLYFLMESVLGAPQVVSKMELKTNHKDEVKGSDGIHMRWNQEDEVVDIFFGEAKLIQDSSQAIASAIKSIESFHDSDMRRHEFSMVTKHFKYADENVKTAVTNLLADGVPSSDVRINHACLIGYNWAEYGKLPQVAVSKLTEEFKNQYLADSTRLHTLLQKRFDSFKHKHLLFDVFFLPFPSVQDFRDAFNSALN